MGHLVLELDRLEAVVVVDEGAGVEVIDLGLAALEADDEELQAGVSLGQLDLPAVLELGRVLVFVEAGIQLFDLGRPGLECVASQAGASR